jgi:hypothetical protein
VTVPGNGKICVILAAAACVISCWPASSFAGEAQNDIEWNPVSAGPITTWSAPVCEQGKLVAQPFFFYNRTRGVFEETGHYKPFTNKETKSQFQEQLFLQYGVTDRFEIDAQGVYQQNLRHADGKSAEATGFGDTYLFECYCLADDKGWMPCVSAWFQQKFPTGKYQKADEGKLDTDLMSPNSGGGSYDTGYGFVVTKKLKPFVFHADFIYSIPMLTRVDGVKTRYGDYYNYDFGAEYFMTHGFNLMLEFNFFAQGDTEADGELIPASDEHYFNIAPGIGWSNDKIQTLLAYRRTVAGTNTDVNDSLIFTLVYTF